MTKEKITERHTLKICGQLSLSDLSIIVNGNTKSIVELLNKFDNESIDLSINVVNEIE